MLKRNLLVSSALVLTVALSACTDTPEEPVQPEVVEPPIVEPIETMPMAEPEPVNVDPIPSTASDGTIDDGTVTAAGNTVTLPATGSDTPLMVIPDDLDEDQIY